MNLRDPNIFTLVCSILFTERPLPAFEDQFIKIISLSHGVVIFYQVYQIRFTVVNVGK